MDVSKMMLAVEIQKMAVASHAAAHLEQKAKTKEKVELTVWLAHNPVKSFVPGVIAQLSAIADLVIVDQ